jgi:hypothetical protein
MIPCSTIFRLSRGKRFHSYIRARVRNLFFKARLFSQSSEDRAPFGVRALMDRMGTHPRRKSACSGQKTACQVAVFFFFCSRPCGGPSASGLLFFRALRTSRALSSAPEGSRESFFPVEFLAEVVRRDPCVCEREVVQGTRHFGIFLGGFRFAICTCFLFFLRAKAW